MTKRQWRPLRRKQNEDNTYWIQVWQNISEIVTKKHITELTRQTIAELKDVVAGKKVAYCWSGGKDSQALRYICEKAKIKACVLGISNLEYPTFAQWVKDNAPDGLEIINTGQDLQWLADHPDMLFPQDSATAARWFKVIQHTAQEKFYREHDLDMIALGRRRQDGNYMGRDGTGIYTSRGVTRCNPIKDWTHEEILAFCHYYEMPLPPTYTWPNGFVVGTGAWSARQWTKTTMQGWYEVDLIDSSVVIEAADCIPSAQGFLEQMEQGIFVPDRPYHLVEGYWICEE